MAVKVEKRRVKRRGCGFRQPGGVYLTVPTSPNGKPVTHFLLDPTLRPDDLGGLLPPAQGILPVPEPNDDRVVFLLDWVGENFYPHPLDFIAEVDAMGLSRRIPKSALKELAYLERPTWLLMLWHRRASVSYDQMPDLWAVAPDFCPQVEGCEIRGKECRPEHRCPRRGYCPRFHWLLEEPDWERFRGQRVVEWESVKAPIRLEYEPAAFMLIQVPCIEVVVGPDGEGMDVAEEVAAMRLPLEVVAVQDIPEE